MKDFARIETGIVAELLATDADLSITFHPALDWREVAGNVEIGWCLTETGFQPPPPSIVMPQVQPTLSELEAELTKLVVRFAALKAF
jgi:hypothetical protein